MCFKAKAYRLAGQRCECLPDSSVGRVRERSTGRGELRPRAVESTPSRRASRLARSQLIAIDRAAVGSVSGVRTGPASGKDVSQPLSAEAGAARARPVRGAAQSCLRVPLPLGASALGTIRADCRGRYVRRPSKVDGRVRLGSDAGQRSQGRGLDAALGVRALLPYTGDAEDESVGVRVRTNSILGAANPTHCRWTVGVAPPAAEMSRATHDGGHRRALEGPLMPCAQRSGCAASRRGALGTRIDLRRLSALAKTAPARVVVLANPPIKTAIGRTCALYHATPECLRSCTRVAAKARTAGPQSQRPQEHVHCARRRLGLGYVKVLLDKARQSQRSGCTAGACGKRPQCFGVSNEKRADMELCSVVQDRSR